jgi:hypothetical protein
MESGADKSGRGAEKTITGVRKAGVGNMSNSKMPKSEAKRIVLEFMAQYDVPMPPTVLHRGLRLHKNFTYSDETLLNYLGELVEDGLVVRIDPQALHTRDIVPLTDADTRGYYLITDDGRDFVAE